jgi:hypothetical protein
MAILVTGSKSDNTPLLDSLIAEQKDLFKVLLIKLIALSNDERLERLRKVFPDEVCLVETHIAECKLNGKEGVIPKNRVSIMIPKDLSLLLQNCIVRGSFNIDSSSGGSFDISGCTFHDPDNANLAILGGTIVIGKIR